MKISLDAGALCTKMSLHFGNYTFTQNLLKSLQRHDGQNKYYSYSFCEKPEWLKESRNLSFQNLRPEMLWLSTRVSIEEIINKKDIFLALNQAVPFYTSAKIISFSHGLSFYFYPQYYPDSYHALKDQLKPMVRKSAYIVVPSRRVKNEMEKLFPKFNNFKIRNYGVPDDMLVYKKTKRKKYFLFVGMNNKIKNIEFIVKSFKIFKNNGKFSDFKLFLVGNLENYEDAHSGIFTFSNIDREEIKKLYSEATAYLTASYYESFNFPVLEALSQNCQVIGLDGAIIPEFTEFVYLAYDSVNFVNHMIACARNKGVALHRETILKRFSWKKYVSKLVELYE